MRVVISLDERFHRGDALPASEGRAPVNAALERTIRTAYDRHLDDEQFMLEALAMARRAEAAGEVPVGAVLVHGGAVVACANNSPILLNDPTAHAEMRALREAAGRLMNYRLSGATMYVTLEPCAMCAGALVIARVARLVFGCRDLRFGAVRSKFRIADSDLLNHRVEITEGVLAADCAELMKAFFERRR